MLYSKTTRGFYNESTVYPYTPDDLVKVSDEDYYRLLDDQSRGMEIVPDENGYPISVEPAKSIPTSCTPSQGLIALYILKGITESDIQSVIDSIADAVERYKANIAFSRAITWERDSLVVNTIASLLNLSSKDLDDLFIKAATIQP